MSVNELSRVAVLARVKAGTLSVKSAAVPLGVGYRQAKRLVRRIATGIENHCSALTGGARAQCNKEQQNFCFALFKDGGATQ